MTALGAVVRLQGEARWGEARAVLDQAKQRLGAGGPADLKARLERMRGELELVQNLDAIRLKKATIVEGRFDSAGVDREYAEAFRAAGMAAVGGDAAAAAKWVAGSGVRDAVVAALDDWASCAQERGRRDWVLEVARRADPDPWRDRARDPAVWADAATLARLAGEEQAAKQSPQLLDAVGERMILLGGAADPLLRAAQERSPGDFWINFDLGNALAQAKKSEEAVGYYRAALAVRPGTVAVYNNIGLVLRDQGKGAEAATEYRTAIALDPKYALPHNNIGLVLAAQGKGEEAAAEYRKAIALDPKLALPHNNIGLVLAAQGKGEEAAAEYRKAIALDPKLAAAHNNIGKLLLAQGKGEEAIAEFRTAIALDPKIALPHNGLGAVLLARGKGEEAIAEFRTAIALDPKLAQPHYNLGNVLLAQGKGEEAAAEYRTAIALNPKFALPHLNLGKVLDDQGKGEEAAVEYRTAIALDPKDARPHNNLGKLLLDQGKGEEAAAEYRKAIALDPKLAQPHYNLGNVLYDQGKGAKAAAECRTAIALDPKDAQPHNGLGAVLRAQGKGEEAVAEFRRAIALDPKDAAASGNLGVTLLQTGKLTEARQALQRCLELLPADDPRRNMVLGQLQWCEQMLTLDRKLPAILKGDSQPADADEQASLAVLCHIKKRHAAAARFYADAFAAKPALADDVQTGNRYEAACCAALAAAGQGEDADKLDDKERARLRQQALGWLRDDLAGWRAWRRQQEDAFAPAVRGALRETLQHWREDPDLAGVRDAAALDKLPESERADWKKLWADVDALLKKVQEK